MFQNLVNATAIPTNVYVQFGVNALGQLVPVAITCTNTANSIYSGLSAQNISNLPIGGNIGGGFWGFPNGNLSIPLANIAAGTAGQFAIAPTGQIIAR